MIKKIIFSIICCTTFVFSLSAKTKKSLVVTIESTDSKLIQAVTNEKEKEVKKIIKHHYENLTKKGILAAYKKARITRIIKDHKEITYAFLDHEKIKAILPGEALDKTLFNAVLVSNKNVFLKVLHDKIFEPKLFVSSKKEYLCKKFKHLKRGKMCYLVSIISHEILKKRLLDRKCISPEDIKLAEKYKPLETTRQTRKRKRTTKRIYRKDEIKNLKDYGLLKAIKKDNAENEVISILDQHDEDIDNTVINAALVKTMSGNRYLIKPSITKIILNHPNSKDKFEEKALIRVLINSVIYDAKDIFSKILEDGHYKCLLKDEESKKIFVEKINKTPSFFRLEAAKYPDLKEDLQQAGVSFDIKIRGKKKEEKIEKKNKISICEQFANKEDFRSTFDNTKQTILNAIKNPENNEHLEQDKDFFASMCFIKELYQTSQKLKKENIEHPELQEALEKIATTLKEKFKDNYTKTMFDIIQLSAQIKKPTKRNLIKTLCKEVSLTTEKPSEEDLKKVIKAIKNRQKKEFLCYLTLFILEKLYTQENYFHDNEKVKENLMQTWQVVPGFKKYSNFTPARWVDGMIAIAAKVGCLDLIRFIYEHKVCILKVCILNNEVYYYEIDKKKIKNLIFNKKIDESIKSYLLRKMYETSFYPDQDSLSRITPLFIVSPETRGSSKTEEKLPKKSPQEKLNDQFKKAAEENDLTTIRTILENDTKRSLITLETLLSVSKEAFKAGHTKINPELALYPDILEKIQMGVSL